MNSMIGALAPQVEPVSVSMHFQSPGSAPEWIELIPAGEFAGRDQRRFVNDKPDQVVAAFRAYQAALPVDIEHASELKATIGEAAPAQGWVEDMDVRAGAVWGRIEWNDPGRALIANRQYRYYSPVLWCSKKTRQVAAVKSVALTNTPNLYIPALNRADHLSPSTETAMDFSKFAIALGLVSAASESDILTAINSLKTDRETALNRAESPDANKFVPRATHELALNRATTAETKLAEVEKAALEKDIEVELNAALTAGKIAPANKDYYAEQCRAEGGLEKFRAFVKAAPKVVPDPSNLGKKPSGEASESGVKAPAGYSVDMNRAELHKKALAYQIEHKCSYADAAVAVSV